MSEICLKLQVDALEEGGYVATSPDLPGLVAQGRTLAETIEIAHDVARKLIESYEEHGDPLPSGIKKTDRHVDIDIAVGIS
ncbi:MAG: type II toxin-antitoxin system HicB family antitoxin [Nitrospinae bacterium]|nr:type II toxin-antitoxin system HicB family antitoxin [Nitrospinota bacterium]